MGDVLTLKEIQKYSYELLVEFANICEENNLKYYLAGGTLIGAVRHKGFIPWDDDCDVLMFRDDYKKLIEICSKKETKKNRKLISLYDNSLARNYAKYIRLDYEKEEKGFIKDASSYMGIDIFPVDYISENTFKFKFQINLLWILRKLQLASVTKYGSGKTPIHTFVKNIYRPFAKMIGKYRIARWMDNVCQWCSSSDYVGAISGMYGAKEKWKKEDFDKGIEMLFETQEFFIPEKYDIYLTNLYGDYMQLPPIEKQKPIENVVFRKCR